MKKLTTLMMILAITLLGSDKITELKNTQTEIIVQVDTAYRMGDADSIQSAKKQVLEKAKILASEYAGTYVESNVELVNGKLTKNEVSTLSRAFVSQSITKEQFKMLDNGFMILEATVQSTINKKGMLDKLETISQSKENKNKIAQIQQSNEKLQEELLQVNNELSSLKNSTAALAQKLLAKRETIYKELDANDNVVLTKLNKDKILTAAINEQEKFEAFQCKVNSYIYILENELKPKVINKEVKFNGETYALKLEINLNPPKGLLNNAEIGVSVYEDYEEHKSKYAKGKELNLEIKLDNKYSQTLNIAGFSGDRSDKYIHSNFIKGRIYYFYLQQNPVFKGSESFTAYQRSIDNNSVLVIFDNLSSEEVATLENVSFSLRGNYELNKCVQQKYAELKV